MTKREAAQYEWSVSAFYRTTKNQGTREDYDALRRASMTLRRWFERECGDQWGCVVERDEATGIPYRVRYTDSGGIFKSRIADRETGARKRIAAICAKLGLYYFIQTDPRGAALYVSDVPLTDSDYNRGLCIG